MNNFYVPDPLARKIRRGKRWVYNHEIDIRPLGGLEPGSLVIVHGQSRKDYIATAFYNPHSRIVLRILTTRREPVNPSFIRRRLEHAWRSRREILAAWPDTDGYRLIHGEADGLPGLIIDLYGHSAVVQVTALGMEVLMDWVWPALADLGVESVLEKSISMARRREGLADRIRVVAGDPPGEVLTVHEFGNAYPVPWKTGQKTGFYLDQKLNRQWVQRHAVGRSILDICCYTGSFAIAAARGGASSVTAVDTTRPGLELADRFASSLDLACPIEWVQADMFAYLRHLHQDRRRFGLIVLDPPPLSPRRKDRRRALEAYRELNRQAIRLLQPGGFLLTCSCSQAISMDDFLGVLRQAASSLPKSLQVLETMKAPPDHPALLGLPETDYFHSIVLRTAGLPPSKA